MEHKIWYDDQDGIAYLEFVGDYFRKDVKPVVQGVIDILEGKSIKQIIIKMSDLYKVENRETREASNKGLQSTGVTEVAFVGGSAANRMIARVLIKTGVVKVNGDFFKETQKAIGWLKSKRS